MPTLIFLPAAAANRPCTSMSLGRGLLVGRGWRPRRRAARGWEWRPGRRAGAAGAPGVDRPGGLACGPADFLGHGRFLAGRFLCSGKGSLGSEISGPSVLARLKEARGALAVPGVAGLARALANAPIPLKAAFITALEARWTG